MRIRIAASHSRLFQSLLALALPLALGAGCSRQAQLTLQQPFAPPAQQHIELQSTWAYLAAAEGRQNMLLAFPLPGSENGPRDFLLYLSLPPGTGRFVLQPDDPNGAAAFLIQAVGQFRGKTVFCSGQVEVQEMWLAAQYRQVDLSLASEDGTVVTGRALIEHQPSELRSFGRRYAADVALLRPTEPPDAEVIGPAQAAAATEERAASTP